MAEILDIGTLQKEFYYSLNNMNVGYIRVFFNYFFSSDIPID